MPAARLGELLFTLVPTSHRMGNGLALHLGFSPWPSSRGIESAPRSFARSTSDCTKTADDSTTAELPS